MSDEKVFPREEARGSGTTIAYSVEVRTTFTSPQKIGEFILDDKWRPYRFQKSDFGVPNVLHDHHASQAGL